MIRAFIAIELNKAVHDELASLQETLKKAGADVTWVKPENIHLTLKFLGDITNEQVEAVKASLDDAAKATSPFSFKLKQIGAFPKLEYPRVLWVGLEGDSGACLCPPAAGEGGRSLLEEDDPSSLYKKIEESLAKLNFPKEARKFTPHLTLGRVRSPKNKGKLIHLIKSAKFESKNRIDATAVTLFQSTLTPNGSAYTMLRRAKFRPDLCRRQ